MADFVLRCLGMLLLGWALSMPYQKESEAELPFSIFFKDVHSEELRKEENIPSSFCIEQCFITADTVVDKQELFILMGINEESIITREAFIKGLKRLAYKQKFEQVDVRLLKKNNDIYDVYIQCFSYWTVHKVIVDGPLIGKDKYRQYYEIGPGERFDESQHQHSLTFIEKVLISEGYVNAQVTAQLYPDETTKSYTIRIYLGTGDSFIIDDIRVTLQGLLENEKVTGDTLAHTLKKIMSHDLLGLCYHEQTVQAVVERVKEYLWCQGYSDATIIYDQHLLTSPARLYLDFTITLFHRKIFEFFGNHFFSSQELAASLASFEKVIACIPSSIITQELITLYNKKGFWQACIIPHDEQGKTVFCITEGPRAEIIDIVLDGVHAFSPSFILKNFFADTNGFVDADTLARTLEQLMQEYKNNGFWDIEVQSLLYEPVNDNQWNLRLILYEGKQRFFKGIHIEGVENNTQIEHLLSEYINVEHVLLELMPFDIRLIQEQRQWLIKYLQDHGYIYALPQATFHEQDDGIEVHWHVTGMKEPVRFGPTIVTGSNAFPSSLIARELCYNEEDIFDRKKIDQTVRRLHGLGIFETVSLAPFSMIQPEDHKIMMARCILDDPFEIRTRLGAQLVSKNFTFRGGASYKLGGSFIWKNPSNNADIMQATIDVTRYRRDITASYTLPWLGSLPLKTEVRIYSSCYDQPVIVGSPDRLYTAEHDGILLGCVYNKEWWEVGINIGLEWMATKGISSQGARAIHFEPRFVDVKIPYFFIEPSFFLDCLDDDIFPTYGSLTLLSCKGMFSFRWPCAFLLKCLLEQAFFVPLATWLVMGMRLRGGYIIHENFKTISPTERFYLGGAHSLRGYETDFAPPLGKMSCELGGYRLVPIGGKSMVNGIIEFRFPLYRPHGRMPYFDAVIFNDIGILVQDSFSTVAPNQLLGATGVGILYHTPFGPLRFDIGWKWHKSFPEESPVAWFLTLGHTF